MLFPQTVAVFLKVDNLPQIFNNNRKMNEQKKERKNEVCFREEKPYFLVDERGLTVGGGE